MACLFYTTPFIARRALLSAVLLPLAAGCTVISAEPSSTGDFAATDTDTDTDTDTTGSGTGTTGQEVDVDCDLLGAESAVVITWALDKEVCPSEEGCDATRSAPCTVSAIDNAGPIVVDLACDDPDLGPTADTVSLTMTAYGDIDLEVGAAVTLEQRITFGFETHGGSSVRLLDSEGLPVIAGLYLNRYGATSGDPTWQQGFLLSEIQPLGGAVSTDACGDMRGAVQIVDGDASIWLPSGGDGLLVGPRRWQISVDEVSKAQDYDDGTIDVALVRVKG